MNRIKHLLLTVVSIGLFTSCDASMLFPSETNSVTQLCTVEADVGACAAIQDEALDLNKMLTYSLQDEYLAFHEYDVLINEKGYGKPFTNIILAEQTHIEALLPLLDWYGVEAVDPTLLYDHAVIPNSLEEALHIGVNAEIINIEMYENFLQHDIPSDVAEVFTRLMDASQNHLRAFQNNLDRITNQL